MTDPNTVIVTEDIFGKAARDFCRRIGVRPEAHHSDFTMNESHYRDELEILAERINALKSAGAI